MIKATILTNEYPPYIYGGAGVHVRELVKNLSELAMVSVYCFGKSPSDKTELPPNKNPSVYAVYSNIQNNLLKQDKLVSILENNIQMVSKITTTDVIHCHTWYTFLAGLLLQKTLGNPLCLTLHSVEAERPWKKEQLGTGYLYSSWIEKTACQQADGIIAISQAVKNAVITHYDVPSEKITIIHNGVDVDFFKPNATDKDELKKYGVDIHKPYFLFVGRMTKQKGFPILFAAIEHISREAQVVICASHADTPDELEMVESKIAELIKNGYSIVWVKQMLAQELLLAFYVHAVALLCTSIYEPCALVCLEAISCGIPVIATGTGGNPEIIVDNQTGFLIPLDDKVGLHFGEKANQLLRNPDLLNRLKINARQYTLDHFSWKINSRSVFEFYQTLIKNRNSSNDK